MAQALSSWQLRTRLFQARAGTLHRNAWPSLVRLGYAVHDGRGYRLKEDVRLALESELQREGVHA